IGVPLAKIGAAVFTGSTAMAAEAAHSLADNANDLALFVAQRRSSRPPDDQHPLGYGREAYFWALIAALGVFIAGAAFSLRDGIEELIHPSATSSFAVAYVVLGISAVLDLLSFRQSAGQMSRRARRYHRGVAGRVQGYLCPLASSRVRRGRGVGLRRRARVCRAGPESDYRVVGLSGGGRGAHRAGDDPRQPPAHLSQPRLPGRRLDGGRQRAAGPRCGRRHPAAPAS